MATGHQSAVLVYVFAVQASAQPFLVFGLLTAGLAVGAANSGVV